MTIREHVAYLEGLAEGMSISSTDSGKLFSAIIDTLGIVADEIENLSENALDIGEELDTLSDDLAKVEDYLEDFNIDDDDDLFDDDDWDDFDGAYDDDSFGCEDCEGCSADEFPLDVNCPECNAAIEISAEDVANESVTCPVCGKTVDLQIDEVDIDEDNQGS